MPVMVISGGSSGIGAAIVLKFLANGYQVFNLDLVDNPQFASQVNYRYRYCDVCFSEQLQAALAEIAALCQSIKVVVVSAGKHLAANIENTSLQQLTELVNLNLFGAYWLIHYSLPYMKQAGGSIITIGSDQSSIAKANSAVYGMTKAALAHLTKSTALDYAKYNIRANCIAAGTIDTPLYRQAILNYSQVTAIPLAEIEQNEANQQPLGRIGQAQEVAEVAYFLAQDTVSYLTGGIIPLDGGYTIS